MATRGSGARGAGAGGACATFAVYLRDVPPNHASIAALVSGSCA